MPKRHVEFFLIDILISLDIVKRAMESIKTPEALLRDEYAWLAVTRSLEIVGEAMKYVLDSKVINNSLIKPSWREVVDFRNVVAHEYFGLSAHQIFNIANIEAVELESEIIDLLNKMPDQAMVNYVIDVAQQELQNAYREMSVEYLENLKQKLAQ